MNLRVIVLAVLCSFVGGAFINTAQGLDKPGDVDQPAFNTFDPRDTWHTVNITHSNTLYSRSSKIQKKPHNTGIGGAILQFLSKPIDVLITWYTGHDLLNPSCWANGDWTPTDKSYVCALTLQDWKDKPECLSFVQLCLGPHPAKNATCVVVRVVDSCAGCKPGSHHVDLTKAPFEALLSLDRGQATVRMRKVGSPSLKTWDTDKWGPKPK